MGSNSGISHLPNTNLSGGKKILFAFDFDHTIVDKNSDVEIIKLLVDDHLPTEVKSVFNGTNWTEYMNAVFQYLNTKGITINQIKQFIMEMKPTTGMVSLLQKINSIVNSKLLIISDANDLFIHTFLSSLTPPIIPDSIITNKAEVIAPDLLKISAYENQSNCSICPKNLCKGSALLEYVRDNQFDQIIYFGDGGNDICPGMKLAVGDMLFVRKGFRLEKIINSNNNGDVVGGNSMDIKAQIVMFDTGDEIIGKLFQ